jgi:outer membrane receptor protein involved in Fe transport
MHSKARDRRLTKLLQSKPIEEGNQMKTRELAKRILRTTFFTGVAATAAAPAFAQDETASDEGERIVVTGSRIVREDLAAPSPVAQIDSEQLVLTNTVNSEEFVNSLPQVIPGADSTSNNPGNGTATLVLRGLGVNRTLILVDGMRFVGSGAGGPVDINNIPSALVERIDVVTGGASAVYGSDAIAGVINFILKDDFEGVQLDVSDRMSVAGWDANLFNTTLTMGGNFADGRGNAVFSASYTNRQALFQGERDFSAFTLVDPGAGSTATGFILSGSSTIPGNRIRGRTTNHFGLADADGIAANGEQPVGFPECTAPNNCQGFFFPDASGVVSGMRFGNPNDFYNFAPVNYLQVPQERYSIFGSASYEVNDNVEIYARGIFANSVVDAQLAPTPFGFTVAINENNPLIPGGSPDGVAAPPAGSTDCVGRDNLFELMYCDPATNVAAPVTAVPNSGPGTFVFRFNKRGEELGNRNSLRDTGTFQISGGIKVDLGNDWLWETQAQFGKSHITQSQTGNVSISAVREAILSNDGLTCTSGNASCAAINLFGGPGSISPAAASYISRTGIQNDTVEQTQIISTLTGVLDSVVSPGAGEGVGLAVGVEYREEYANSLPDSVLGPDVLGFNQSLPVGGRFDVYEAFLEADIPIIQDKPFIEEFSINGAYRYSSYSLAAVGGTHTYAVGGDWVPIEGLRFRAQFQHAVRAPNIGELFAAQVNGFPAASDPCSGGGFGSFSPATLVSTCTATGVPAAAVGTPFQSNGQIEALFGGNPNLFEEKADTLTIGAVWQPSMIDDLTVIVDYYDIDVQQAIGVVGLQTILDACHLLGEPNSCAIISRNPATGEIVSPFLPTLFVQNIASLRARGIDMQVSYGIDGEDFGIPGSFNMTYFGNYYLSNGFEPDPLTGFVECKGLYGPTCGEPTPRYKHTMQAAWLWGPLTTSVRWRLLSGVEADCNDTACVSDLSDDIGMFNYVDVTLQYAVSEHLDLTVGVSNITGKDAPIIGSTVNEQANTWPATYETLGRELFFGASLRF